MKAALISTVGTSTPLDSGHPQFPMFVLEYYSEKEKVLFLAWKTYLVNGHTVCVLSLKPHHKKIFQSETSAF